MYYVATYVGDYPAENQDYWLCSFMSKSNAIEAAEKQHNKLVARIGNDIHTYICVKDKDDDFIAVWLRYKDETFHGVNAERFSRMLEGHQQ